MNGKQALWVENSFDYAKSLSADSALVFHALSLREITNSKQS